MVEHLSVRNFAIIESAEVDLPHGLVVFSGETGAGKSLIVGAMNFIFGSRADPSLLREGSSECTVSATILIEGNNEAKSWLFSHELEAEEGRVILRRGLRNNGRSYAYIQERQVTRNELQEFTGFLADIHGQHEHQKLLDQDVHLEMLDEFASLAESKAEYKSKYDAWIAALKDYRLKAAEAEKCSRERETFAASVAEIQSAKPRKGEDEELQAEEKKISQHEKLFRELSDAAGRLSTSAEGGVGQLRHAIGNFNALKGIDPVLDDLRNRLEQGYLELEDITASLGTYLFNLRFDPARLEEIEVRLAELRRLKKKYGPSLDDVLSRFETDNRKLADASSWDIDKIKLENTITELRTMTLSHAERLAEQRKEAAQRFSREVEAILGKLGMDHAQLALRVEKTLSPEGKLTLSSTGMDRIEMMISPNLGEAPKPLIKIASGGELSRVALAIKAVSSTGEAADTLVFDEIDSGIGGEVGVAVGTYLKAISRNRQVFCVTHLASIAVRADTHVVVSKHVENGRTLTKIEELSGEAREMEIARMLAGDKDRDASRLHAAEMLKSSRST